MLSLLKIIAGLLLLPFIEGFVALVGAMVFGVLTLGLVKVQGDGEDGLKFPWYGFTRNKAGQLVVHMDIASAIGVVVSIVGTFVVFYVLKHP